MKKSILFLSILFCQHVFGQYNFFSYWKARKPNNFSFTNQTGVNPATIITSDAITLAGFTGPFTATCSGCTLERNNSGSFSSSVSDFVAGDTIRIRVTSSSSFSTAVTASVTIDSTTSGTWSVTTRAANNCTGTPWGTVAHGFSGTAYQFNNTSCATNENRTCNDGVMSGSFLYTTCSACNNTNNTTNMCAGRTYTTSGTFADDLDYNFTASGSCVSPASYCQSGSGTCLWNAYHNGDGCGACGGHVGSGTNFGAASGSTGCDCGSGTVTYVMTCN